MDGVKFDESAENASNSAESGNQILVAESCCQRCQKAPATHASDPCAHYKVCQKCAMKLATGGKCRTCSRMYVSFRQITGKKQEVDSDEET